MPEKPRGGIEKLIGDAEVAAGFSPRSMSDLDKLIADAENAATEALRAGAAEELKTVSKKKKVSAESAGRAEQLQQWFSALKADDAFVEDYGYEYVFQAAEAETGVASPEKTRELIESLRKSGAALRKLGAVEPKSDALLGKMEDLQTLHDKLFDQVQTATTDALDSVKKKFKGEETEFEKRYKDLYESPLVRVIEFDVNSPEAREIALKQEITEFLMMPLSESRIKSMEGAISLIKYKLAKLQEASSMKFEGASADFNAARAAMDLGLLSHGNQQGFKPYLLYDLISRNIHELNAQLEAYETHLTRERLAFEVNRDVIEELLEDEHDETELREGMVELRNYIVELRKNYGGHGLREDWRSKVPKLKSKLAQKILGHYQQYAVSMPDFRGFQISNLVEESRKVLSPAEQLLGGQWYITGYEQTIAEYLRSQSRLDLLKSKLGAEIEDEEVFRLFRPNAVDLTPEFIQSLYEDGPQHFEVDSNKLKEKLFAKFPTADVLINRIFGEQGKLFNLRRAYQKIDAGLQGKKKPGVVAMPEALAKAGCKESKLGAFVEPGQDTRAVDREYARVLERLSKPQVEAERAFDIRGHEGEFHVYTIEQAMNLLRRARRDARNIVGDSDRAVAEMRAKIEGDKAGKEGLEAQVKRIGDQLEAQRNAAAAREKELNDRLTNEHTTVGRMQLDGDKRVAKETARSNETIRGLVEQFKVALNEKPGLLGGEKHLREAVEKLVRQMEGK